MEREEIENNLLSFRDLQQRWNYKSIHAPRKRKQYDRKFPKPIKVMGNGAMLFWLPEIEVYEKLRGGIDASQNRYKFYESKKEWNTKTREEREKQRGDKYSDEEWGEIESSSKATSPIGDV